MNMKNLKDLGEKVAIQCKTLGAFIEIKRQLNAINLEDNYWCNYKENTCIRVSDNTFSGLDFFIEEGYNILQASDFMPLSPQDEIKELKARISTLEGTLRPKKKIEFVKYLGDNMNLEDVSFGAKHFKVVELIYRYDDYDIMEAYDDETDNKFIYLGHFNDGIK